MSQHDFVIANAAAASVRSDLNDALQALASVSSGSNAPATTYAGMLWYETDTNWIHQRNEANTGWHKLLRVRDAGGVALLEGAQILDDANTEIARIDVHADAAWTSGTNNSKRLVSPAQVRSSVTTYAVQRHSAPVAQAWATGRFSGNPVIDESYNIASITDLGGNHDNAAVTFETPMANAQYAVVGSSDQAGADFNPRNFTTDGFGFYQTGSASRWSFAVFGERSS